jgi:hypothetical protein
MDDPTPSTWTAPRDKGLRSPAESPGGPKGPTATQPQHDTSRTGPSCAAGLRDNGGDSRNGGSGSPPVQVLLTHKWVALNLPPHSPTDNLSLSPARTLVHLRLPGLLRVWLCRLRHICQDNVALIHPTLPRPSPCRPPLSLRSIPSHPPGFPLPRPLPPSQILLQSRSLRMCS